MTLLHIPVSHGRYPEDGEKIGDVAFEDEAKAVALGEQMTEGDYGHSEYFVKTVEVSYDE